MVSKHHNLNENTILASNMSQNLTNQPTTHIENPLIALNITTQINKKLIPSTFPQCCAQFEVLLIGYDLLDYVTGLSVCPLSDGTPQSTLKTTHWVRQEFSVLPPPLLPSSPPPKHLMRHGKNSFTCILVDLE